MAILRKKQRGQYTVIDNTIFRDATLSNKALGMLCRMLSLPDGWEFSVMGLASLSTDGKSAVMSQLDELEKHGYLVRRQVRKDNKIAGVEYVVSETRMSDFLNTENQHTGNQHTGNPPQSITKESITKESITESSSLRSEDIYGGLPENLIEALMAFEQMRKDIKKPIKSDRARTRLLNKLDSLAGEDTELKVAILDQSIFNNWQDVYELKGDNNNGERMGKIYNGTAVQDSRGMAGATGRSNSDSSEGIRFPKEAYGYKTEA